MIYIYIIDMRILLVTFITLFFYIGMHNKWCSLNEIFDNVSGSEGLPPEQLSFAKFKDIPIPDGAVMDMENTVIFCHLLQNLLY